MRTRKTMQATSLAAPPHTRLCLLASTRPSTDAAQGLQHLNPLLNGIPLPCLLSLCLASIDAVWNSKGCRTCICGSFKHIDYRNRRCQMKFFRSKCFISTKCKRLTAYFSRTIMVINTACAQHLKSCVRAVSEQDPDNTSSGDVRRTTRGVHPIQMTKSANLCRAGKGAYPRPAGGGTLQVTCPPACTVRRLTAAGPRQPCTPPSTAP